MDFFKHVFSVEDPIDPRITEELLDGNNSNPNARIRDDYNLEGGSSDDKSANS